MVSGGESRPPIIDDGWDATRGIGPKEPCDGAKLEARVATGLTFKAVPTIRKSRTVENDGAPTHHFARLRLNALQQYATHLTRILHRTN